MKKTTSLILVILMTLSVSGCEVFRPAATKAENKVTTASPVKTKPTVTKESSDSTEASTGTTEPTDTTTTETEPVETTTPETEPVETTTTETKSAETKPDADIKSNLPPKLRAELDKNENGIMLIYYPEKFSEIKAITRWNIIDYNTNTQVFLVTKKKGSIVEVSKAELTNDDRVVIAGEVIRDWKTTSDFEVIRILYTDPETIPFNFIKVKEPGGKVTTTHLRTSMRDNPDWEVYKYDE